jgi:hypothetical protein
VGIFKLTHYPEFIIPKSNNLWACGDNLGENATKGGGI